MLRVVIGLLLTLSLAAIGGAAWWVQRPCLSAGEVAQVEIPRGVKRPALLQRLKAAGLRVEPFLFRLSLRLMTPQGVRAGAYQLSGPMDHLQLAERLSQGAPPPTRRVTLLPGWSRWDVADALAAAGVSEREAFLRLVEEKNGEGRLYPDSYDFYPNTPPERVLIRLFNRFDRAWAEVKKSASDSRCKRRGRFAEEATLERHRGALLSLAALVEREAQRADERPLIARVFYNRLAKRMRLQSDPSCVYGSDRYKEKPSPALCHGERANRWSTYRNHGLPPTPIGSPRLESLSAALCPSEAEGAEKLLFFVARQDGSGAHHFSATYSAHQRAVQRYLRGDTSEKE
ncbi:MAG: endolytic transglycosylase MltG [Myxococcota bacterium]|nr:endolytic transglycosylase MltG [Myxococcota bacterium]